MLIKNRKELLLSLSMTPVYTYIQLATNKKTCGMISIQKYDIKILTEANKATYGLINIRKLEFHQFNQPASPHYLIFTNNGIPSLVASKHSASANGSKGCHAF